MKGVTTRLVSTAEGGITIVRSQDVAPILDRNKALAAWNDGYSPSRELRRAASIPLIVAEKWRNEEGIDVFNPDHWPAVKRKLNSSDYAYLRTAPGKL